MVNIIHRTVAIFNGNQRLQHADNIFLGQYAFTGITFNTEATIKFHPAYTGQIIAFLIKEQIFKQPVRRIFRRWLTRTHHAINFGARIILIRRFIDTQRISNICPPVQLIDIKRFKRFHAQFNEFNQVFFCQHSIGRQYQFATFLVDEIFGKNFADNKIHRHNLTAHIFFFQLAHMAGSNPLARFNQHFAICHNIESNRFALELRRLKFHFQLVLADFETLRFKKFSKNLRIGITQCV